MAAIPALRDDLQWQMLALINAARAGQGRGLLRLERHLGAAARAHSDWMMASDSFSHAGAGGSDPAARMRAARMDLSGGWRSAENIAAVTLAAEDAIEDAVVRLHDNLMNSQGHREPLLDPQLTLIGIGFALGPLSYAGTGRLNSLLVTQNFAATGGQVALE